MIFKELSLYNFKNFETLDISFDEGINCLVGHNGAGKTNILDALHYLALTKSSINSTDASNINFNASQFMIKGEVMQDKHKHIILCTAQSGKKKEFKVNAKEYEKLSHHIGRFPLIMISPNDTHLIYDSNEVRRRLFDAAISQNNTSYLKDLIAYNFALKNRNALLKNDVQPGKGIDADLLQTYSQQLITHGISIYKERNTYINSFLKLFKKEYSQLHKQNEEVSIEYSSQMEGLNKTQIGELFKNSWQKDVALQRTTVGIHKDAYNFSINDVPLKKHGSQGQQKTFIIALKLAQFSLLAKQKGIKPVLLLDDIFDKLDDERMHKLLNKVASAQYGQLFITDARAERTLDVIAKNKLKARIFEMDKGAVLKTSQI